MAGDGAAAGAFHLDEESGGAAATDRLAALDADRPSEGVDSEHGAGDVAGDGGGGALSTLSHDVSSPMDSAATVTAATAAAAAAAATAAAAAAAAAGALGVILDDADIDAMLGTSMDWSRVTAAERAWLKAIGESLSDIIAARARRLLAGAYNLSR